MTATPCRHCALRKACRPRRLCWVCSQDAAVRALYPSASKFAPRGFALKAPAAACEPVTLVPGSPEKLAALAGRAEAGQELWSPGDRPCPPEPSYQERLARAPGGLGDDVGGEGGGP